MSRKSGDPGVEWCGHLLGGLFGMIGAAIGAVVGLAVAVVRWAYHAIVDPN